MLLLYHAIWLWCIREGFLVDNPLSLVIFNCSNIGLSAWHHRSGKFPVVGALCPLSGPVKTTFYASLSPIILLEMLVMVP